MLNKQAGTTSRTLELLIEVRLPRNKRGGDRLPAASPTRTHLGLRFLMDWWVHVGLRRKFLVTVPYGGVFGTVSIHYTFFTENRTFASFS